MQKKKRMQAPQKYDESLKLLFSDPYMMECLIKHFLPANGQKELDFSTLSRENVSFVSEKLDERDSDIIWSIAYQGSRFYIVCLLEFQSSTNPFMAIRVNTYLSLLCEELIKQKKFIQGKLPPVFAVVLYTGKAPWNAPIHSVECFTPAILEEQKRYLPNIEYILLDVRDLPLKELSDNNDNLVHTLFALERTNSIAESQAVIEHLIKQLKGPQFSRLRRSFLVYIKYAMQLSERYPGIEFHNLREVNSMLRENLNDWENNIRMEGIEKGIEKNLEKTREIILKLLKNKHGHISEDLKQNLATKSLNELELYVDQLISSLSTDERVAI